MIRDILNSLSYLRVVKNWINKSEFARRFNCSVKTVDKYLNKQDKNKSIRKYSSKLDDFKVIIIEKLMIILLMVEQILISLKIKILLFFVLYFLFYVVILCIF